jgi:hypothetical protein
MASALLHFVSETAVFLSVVGRGPVCIRLVRANTRRRDDLTADVEGFTFL